MTLLLKGSKWLLLVEGFYLLIVLIAIVRIVHDTRSVTKTLAYLLLVIFIPVLGMIFYFSFGINYRKRKIYSKKLKIDESFKADFQKRVVAYHENLTKLDLPVFRENRELISLLSHANVGGSRVLENSEVRILQNGEAFFPVLIEEMRRAKKHIHMQSYIYEDDEIGNQLKEVMIAKAKEGVEVRLLYDDFGSMRIRRGLVKELLQNGVQAFPFNRIRIIGLANRLNYRNHRKIVVIDGMTSFVGGINVADKYINKGGEALYWRDTHLMIRGYSSMSLQQIFLADWNFCAGSNITVNHHYFPLNEPLNPNQSAKLVQVTASGPDSDLPNILYAVIQAVNKAKKEILITTPYYIPDTSLQEALIIAALSSIKVKLLVPERGDSFFVTLASQSYFEELLAAGVKIYLYKKGFVHAKTFVIDRQIASVGTANMDARSFDLNFEVSAIVYDNDVAEELARDFFNDIQNAEELDLREWLRRPKWIVFLERVVRLFSPFM